MESILSILANLLAIIAPIVSMIINNRKKDSSIQKIYYAETQHFHYNRKLSAQKSDGNIVEDIANGVVEESNEVNKYRNIIFLIAILLTIINFSLAISSNSSVSIVARYIDHLLYIGSYSTSSYLVSFYITFMFFFCTPYFLTTYYYDFRLRRKLKNFGVLYQRSSLEKIQRALTKKHQFSHFSIYPVQSIARFIENARIKANNKRRTKMPHDNLKSFWVNGLIIWTIASLVVVHFTFVAIYTPST